ncbi:hypothetical protein DRQ18_06875 [bacterium]|nr:MAG: hypothetical protein DRQ18_06875 [bacterium]
MRKCIFLFALVVLPLNLFGLGRQIGAPPDTLVDSVQVQVIIPERIGLYLETDASGDIVVFDLDAAGYPPASFPAYYDPTDPATSPTVDIEVFSNSLTKTWYLDACGDDFDATYIPITQLEWSPAGAGTYEDFSNGWTNHASGSKTAGWEAHDEDYRFEAQEDDPAGTYTTWVRYRVYAL